MNKIEAVRYLKEQGKDAELIDGVVMLTTTKTGAVVEKEFKAMKKDLSAAGYNGSVGIRSRGQGQENDQSRNNKVSRPATDRPVFFQVWKPLGQ